MTPEPAADDELPSAACMGREDDVAIGGSLGL